MGVELGSDSEVLTYPEKEISGRKFKTEKGIPETQAEYYGVSFDANRKEEDPEEPFLYIFNVGRMEEVHRLNNRRYDESFRFHNVGALIVKDELLRKLRGREIFLFFSEVSKELYRAVLRDEPLEEILSVLGDMERKYSR